MIKALLFCFIFCKVHSLDSEILDQKKQISLKRTACLILSRYHSNSKKDVIEPIAASFSLDQQHKYINKMYVMAIEHCLPIITFEDCEKIFSQTSPLQPSQLFFIFKDFSYQQAASNLESLTISQKNLIRFMEKFDQEQQQSFEISSGSHSIKKRLRIPTFTQFIGMLFFCVFMAYVMSKINSGRNNKELKERGLGKGEEKRH